MNWKCGRRTQDISNGKMKMCEHASSYISIERHIDKITTLLLKGGTVLTNLPHHFVILPAANSWNVNNKKNNTDIFSFFNGLVILPAEGPRIVPNFI